MKTLRKLVDKIPPPPAAPQLLMWYSGRRPPSREILAEGYRLRSFQSGDEPGWLELLKANGQLGTWDLTRIRGELEGTLVRGGQQFVVFGELPVAAAGVYDRKREDRAAWEIGWVASHPEHRGRNLGRAATAAAVTVALGLPERPVYLLTDDFRLPALKMYLRLGFIPDLQHPSYPERWQRLFVQLGDSYASCSPLPAAAQPAE